ncbi:LPS biosynthesis protein WavE [Vibrio aquaticus]|uniref:LPS biosynthesis protein WavE n=1 Tax=Vibrio aquaticus TaxID=2496559 RepID=A0A3S0Q0I6_9VIBR|nr:WavE lipopolysaccharide synthesis family protein [Vibrio aquaticus]RTZ14639.1 LPS biosynthesis protein WavE [Vibrio aquaticus]
MIENQEISFVVQGPVQASQDRKQRTGITEECLRSIREHFPNSPIILSTWKGQNLSGLNYDHLVELDDPGANFILQDDKQLKLNNNRQIYSAHMGLRAVTTKYAVKLRTDNKINGRGFVRLFEQYASLPREDELSLLNSRVVTSSAFFISSHAGKPVYFHKSDLFDFGETEDLLKVWGENLISELSFSKKGGYKSRYPATEQFLCLHWVSRLLGTDCHINTKAGDDAGLGDDFWESFIANNLIVDKPENIGLDVTERFYKRGNLALEYDLKDWLYLNGQTGKPFDKKRLYRGYKVFEQKVVGALRN